MTTSARRLAKSVLGAMGLVSVARRIAREIHTLRQNRLSEEEILRLYQTDYHMRAGYGKAEPDSGEWEPDNVLKHEHAKAILTVLPLRRVLVGGCSSGMAVSAFRRLDVAAWGFDVSPDLEVIALPEAKPFLRRGSMTAIPFDSSERFDAIVTTDVLEHVQLKKIDAMLAEIARVSTPWMVHLINHVSIKPDHMTLKPLSWWAKQFARSGYHLRPDLKTPISDNRRIYGLNGDLDHVYTFWQRQGYKRP